MHEVSPRAEKAMRAYLLDHELIVVAVHQHWLRVAGVAFATLLGFILVVAITVVTPASAGRIAFYSWWLWVALALYCLVQLALWRHDWFVVTDRRLLLTYGLISRKIAMMPMSKVTDMSFNQSAIARMLGFGTYVMESAGQDQALRQIDYIPRAASYYRVICEQIFGEDDEDDNDTRHHQRHHLADSREDTDPYGIPLPPYALTEPPLHHHADVRPKPAYDGRPPPAHGPNRRRVIRAATVVSPDNEPSWSVSHEDASPPQQVRPPQDPRADDDGA